MFIGAKSVITDCFEFLFTVTGTTWGNLLTISLSKWQKQIISLTTKGIYPCRYAVFADRFYVLNEISTSDTSAGPNTMKVNGIFLQRYEKYIWKTSAIFLEFCYFFCLLYFLVQYTDKKASKIYPIFSQTEKNKNTSVWSSMSVFNIL